MKPHGLILAATLFACALSACTLMPPISGEERMIDSAPLAADLAPNAVPRPPFCLHLKYGNEFYAVYSDTRTEAWITDGTCAKPGARREIESIRVSWWNDWFETQNNRQCLQTEGCRVNEQHVTGRNIRCAAAQATDGNQNAFITTDQTRCH